MVQMLSFYKYQGLGNDFIILDEVKNHLSAFSSNEFKLFVRKACNRRFGIGADGLIIVSQTGVERNINMKIFNSDGSQAEMCGNGIRCLVRYLLDMNQISHKQELRISTLAGLIKASIDKDKFVTVDMGTPSLLPREIPTLLSIGDSGVPQGNINLEGQTFKVFAAGMGNPHMIIYTSDLQNIKLENLGEKLEKNRFFPADTNVHFVQVCTRKLLQVRVWERGSGVTLACGTGACACAVVSHKLGLCDVGVDVELPGGKLYIEWPLEEGSVYMKGPAEPIFTGEINLLS